MPRHINIVAVYFFWKMRLKNISKNSGYDLSMLFCSFMAFLFGENEEFFINDFSKTKG